MKAKSLPLTKGHLSSFFKIALLLVLFTGLSTALMAQATVMTDKADYLPGETVHITGTGWAPNETVHLLIEHLIFTSHQEEEYATAADASGNIHYDGYYIDAWDLGESFRLTATQGSLIATAYYTDGSYFNLTIGSQTPNPVYQGGFATYLITLKSKTATAFTANNFKTSTLTNATSSFYPSSLSFNADNQTLTTTLTITLDNNTTTQNFDVEADVSGLSNQGEKVKSVTLAVTACTAPSSVSVLPTSANKTVGESFTLNATASGTAPFTYQWKKGGIDISGATGSSYTISSVLVADAGSYDVVVTNLCSSVTSNTATLTVNKATSTISVNAAGLFTYNGSAQGPDAVTKTGSSGAVTYSYVGVSGTTYGPLATKPTNAGSYSVTASLAADHNYDGATSAAYPFTIAKADAVVSVTGYTGVYDAASHGATGSVVGVAGDLAAAGSTLNLGSSFTDFPGGTANWTFTGGTNYNNQNGTAAIVINKAVATIAVNGYTGTYDATPHGATLISATGVAGANLSASVTIGTTTYTNYPGGPVAWSFTNNNYEPQSGSVAIVINKADALVTVTGYADVYDALAHGATGSAIGVEDETLAGLDLGDSFTNVPGGTANWVFTDETGNYNDDLGSVEIVITKATPTATLAVNNSPVTYNASAHAATVGITASSVPGAVANILTGGAASQTAAGTYAVTANFVPTDADNYNSLIALSAGNFVIGKATPTATLVVSNSPVTYDGSAKSATVGITASSVPGAVANILTGGAATKTAAGTYAVTANFVPTDEVNYNSLTALAAGNFIIDKADATIVVEGYTGTYDAAAHGATGSASGVEDEVLAGLDLGASFTNVPGGTANWVFTDVTGNYNDDTGSVEIVIGKATPTATLAVNNSPQTYSGSAQAATVGITASSVPGAVANILTGGAATKTAAETYAVTANFVPTDEVNYNSLTALAAGNFIIDKADATIVVEGYTGTYDAAAHGATGSASGVEDEVLAGLDLGASFTNVPGGTANWVFTDETGNYNDDLGSVEIVIGKATPTATLAVNNSPVTYNASAHAATVGITASSVPGAVANILTGGAASQTAAGTYAVTANFVPTDAVNYNSLTALAAGNFVISKASLSVVAANKEKYCGQINPTLTGVLTGVLGSDGITATYSTTATQASGTGGYSITPVLLDPNGKLGNYNVSITNGILTIIGVSIDASASSTPVQIGGLITLSAKVIPGTITEVSNISVIFTVTNSLDAVINTQTVSTISSGVATSISFSAPNSTDVLKVTAVAGQGCGDDATSVAYLAIYDPNAGFVTGGGWITSPAGAYVAIPTLTGKANFGFVSKYKKGSNIPEGNTEFQFQTGNLNFKSSSYNTGSLVISGAKATYKGVGTINGSGNYAFMVSAVDGDINGGGGTDKFRIKIWDANRVIYDNDLGIDENDLPTTALGGGSIVIHYVKTKIEEAAPIVPIPAEKALAKPTMEVYPNPSNGPVNFRFSVENTDRTTLDIYSAIGKHIATLMDETIETGDVRTVNYTNDLPEGMYMYRLRNGNEVKTGKFIRSLK